MTDYGVVLRRNYPDAVWNLYGPDYEDLEWLSEGPAPSKADLDAAWPSVRHALDWAAVRIQRDRLLSESDWTQVADAPVNAAAWAVYRQKLRDIPQDFDSPDDVVWPAVP